MDEGMGEGQGRDGKDERMEAVEDFARRRAQEGCAPAAVLEPEVPASRITVALAMAAATRAELER